MTLPINGQVMYLKPLNCSHFFTFMFDYVTYGLSNNSENYIF